MDIRKEKRQRFLKNLIKEAVLNVLVEQQPAPPPASAVPPSSSPPSPQMNPNDADVQNPPQPPADGQQEQPFDVDEMVNKLNVLRGSKSFKDPEVYGRLTTFFKNLPEDQKSTLDNLLSELGKIVIDASEQQAGLDQPQQQVNARQPSGGGNPQQNAGVPPGNAAQAPVSPGV